MNETTLKRLNPTETIINALPAITEAFVTFYGESERERITDKFKNLLVVGCSSPRQMSYKINASNKEQSTILINEFLDKLTKDEIEREKLHKLFFSSYDLGTASIQPLHEYMVYLKGSIQSDYHKNKVVTFLKQIHPETTIENLDELIKLGTFKSIDIILPIYEQTLQKYKEYEKETKPYTDYINGCNQLSSSLDKKYIKKLTEELKDLFTEEEYHQIQDVFNSRYYSSINNINAKTQNYIGYSLYSTPLIAAFSEENEKILISGKQWQQDSVKRDRIEYFKNFGLDLGDDYEIYLSNPKTLELIPSKELVERILNTHKEVLNQKSNEYYASLPEYQKNRARIDNADLLDKEDGYDPSIYEKEGTAITTNLKLIDGEYIEYPILLMYMGAMQEYYDANLIHELNHVYELTLHSVEDNRYQMTCGWDIVDGMINNQRIESNPLDNEREKRDYELFNEIINELISQEISEILSQAGIYIFNTKEDKKIKGGTSYERTTFLIRKLYEDYKDIIIESRKNGDIQVLFEAIGKENFESLNQLFHEYSESFSGFRIYQVYQDLQNGIETEETKKFQEIVSKRDAIYTSIEQHSHKRTSSL